MTLTKEKKQELAKTFGSSVKDTGSTAVQVAMLSERINQLTEHLKSFKKDYACQRGLMKLVGQRRRLLNYYKQTRTPEEYKELITSLNIRK
jgi:small subunit ribosomal protein S15